MAVRGLLPGTAIDAYSAWTWTSAKPASSVSSHIYNHLCLGDHIFVATLYLIVAVEHKNIFKLLCSMKMQKEKLIEERA